MLTNRQIIVPYILPYFAYVGLASVPTEVLGREAGYALRIVVVTMLLLWARRWYCSLKGPGSVAASVAWGALAGLAGTVVWVALLEPFVSHDTDPGWSAAAFWLRFAAASLVVPMFEELMMRGFVFRLALQWDEERRKGSASPLHAALDERSPDEVRPGQWSWAAVLVSTAVFTAGHAVPEWPASIAYGLLMCALWVARKDLVSCIVAHAVTNASLALYVLATGRWGYW